MVAVSSIVTMALCALFGIAAPILLGWWLVKKYKVHAETILIGALVFIVFALVLETLMHQLVLKGPHGPAITGNIWYYALYGGLAAGIFEETGRFLAMKYIMKKQPSTAASAVGYAAGHGGAEMLLIFGISMISNIALAVFINTGQADSIIASAPPEMQEQVQGQFAQLQAAGAGTFLLGAWERVSALILQTGLSIMVWTAVREGGKWLWLFPAAILLHFIVDATAVILAKSVSMWAVEAVLCALAVAVGAAGYMLARRYLLPINPVTNLNTGS